MSDHRGIVLHIAQGTYGGTIAWQMNPDQRLQDGTEVTTCSTWIVGKQPGEWAQMVDTEDIAWAQRAGSRTWLSIELAGFVPHVPTAWQMEACAQLLAWAHERHGFALAVADHPDERGLGHHSFDRELLGEEFGHDECPGAGVIDAKAAIVRRAKEIVEGEDMPYKDWPSDHQKALARDVVDEWFSREISRPWDADDPTQRADQFLAWFRTDMVRTRAEVSELRGQLAGLAAMVRGLAGGAGPLTAEQFAQLLDAVRKAAREPAERLTAALAAAAERRG